MKDPLDAFAQRVVVDDSESSGPDIFTNADTAVRSGAKVAQRALPNVAGSGPIDRIQNHVWAQLEDGEHILPYPPYDEVLYRPEIAELLADCFTIVDKYRENGYDANANTVSEDILRLNGNLVHMAGVIGYMNASAEHAEAQRRATKSRTYILAKKARDDISAHITDGEALQLGHTASLTALKNAKAVGLTAATLRNAFYGLRSFSEELSRIANRNHKTEKSLSYVS